MKNSLIILATVVFSVFYFSAHAQSKLENWKELKAFHGVMSATFHPSENGDLKPIRERSGEMAIKATELAASAIPTDFNNKLVKDAVEKLKVDCEKLNQLIKKNGTDDEVKKSLTDLHETFHLIVERCNRGSEEHEHEGKKK